MSTIQVPIVLNDEVAKVPEKGTAGAAGYDVFAVEDYTINPGEWVRVNLKFAVAVPENHLMFLTPKSGLADKFGLTILNSPGLIDSDFRGEVGAIVINHGYNTHSFKAGDKVAQAVFMEYKDAEFDVRDELPATERGEGGFGSTGR